VSDHSGATHLAGTAARTAPRAIGLVCEWDRRYIRCARLDSVHLSAVKAGGDCGGREAARLVALALTSARSGQEVFEYDAGIIAYSLSLPVMSQALAIDKEARDALRAGRLIDLVFERGFTLVSSVAYWTNTPQLYGCLAVRGKCWTVVTSQQPLAS
jgi:hypothetical protein